MSVAASGRGGPSAPLFPTGSEGGTATDTALRRRLQSRLGAHLLAPVSARHDTTEIRIGADAVTTVLRALREDPALRFEVLADLAGVDTGTHMQVVYHLWSPLTPDWLRVIVDGLDRDDPRVASATFLWKGAEWQERETFDMFGIVFEGNRDLRRIYMPPGYESHPLRKDFYLADDVSRSVAQGVRHLEQVDEPVEAPRATRVRRAKVS